MSGKVNFKIYWSMIWRANVVMLVFMFLMGFVMGAMGFSEQQTTVAAILVMTPAFLVCLYWGLARALHVNSGLLFER